MNDKILVTPEGATYEFNQGFMKNAIITGTKNYEFYDEQRVNGYFVYTGREQYISLAGQRTVPSFKIINDKKFIIDNFTNGEVKRYLESI